MWHNLDTKKFPKSILFNKTFEASGNNKGNDNNVKRNMSQKNPAGERMKHNGFDDGCVSIRQPKTMIPYQCWPCGRIFRFKCLFFKHQLSCIKLNKSKKKKGVEQKKRKRNFLIAKRKILNRNVSESPRVSVEFRFCSTCSKGFFSSREYDVHVRSGQCTERIHTCTECSAVFNSASELELHERCCKVRLSLSPEVMDISEEQQKMFKCRCCKSSFHFPELLKVHLQENQMCTKIHNLSMKVECMKRKEDHSGPTARKSFSSPARHQTKYDSYYKSTPKFSDSERDFSFSPSSVGGSARKSFHNSFTSKRSEYPCDKCGIKFSTSVQLKLHAKSHFKPRDDSAISQCPECREVFSDSYQLIQHQTDFDHDGVGTKSLVSTCSCPYCKKIFLHVQSRNAHLRNHTDKTSWEIKEFVNSTTCDICFRNFGTEILKERHAHIAHSDAYADSPNKQTVNFHSKTISKPLKYAGNTTKLQMLDKIPESIEAQLRKVPNVCPICLKEYDSNFARNRHFRLHILDGAYKCEFCFMKFPKANRLATHVQSVHKEFLKYECKECGARFSSRLTVLQHVTKMHAELPNSDRIEECSIPSSIFEDDDFHDERSPRADMAEVRFKQQFYCDVCKLSFLKLCGLRRHQASKLHNKLLETENQAKEKIRDLQLQFPPRSVTPPVINYRKRFTCSVCMKEFTDVHKFIPHRLSHFNAGSRELMNNEVEPYTCEVCGKLMDNYQKIQLHLFWHLQDVQSYAGTSKDCKAKKSMNSSNSFKLPNTPIPAELAGQAVAKKSIKSSGKQELVISGVKKPLFTCKDCTISFPSKHHYLLHMRKYCRARNRSLTRSLDETDNVVANEKERVNCWKCDELFQDRKTLLVHERTCTLKLRNKYCSKCGCLFSSATLYREHKAAFCNLEFSAFIDDDDVQQNMETVKNTMKMDLNIVGCVQCKIMFSNIQMLSQHMKNHKITDNNVRNTSWEDYNMDSDVSTSIKQEISSSNLRKRVVNEISLEDNLMEQSVLELAKMTNGNITAADDFLSGENSQDSFYPLSEAEDDSSTEGANTSEGLEELTELRRNFSRLLSAIVSDASLMDSLGFGERRIDDVLISVLEKMSLVPVDEDDDSLSELDKFRCNIRTLLDVCIKDQIMDFIADYETTTDDIVMAALKMFGVKSEKLPMKI